MKKVDRGGEGARRTAPPEEAGPSGYAGPLAGGAVVLLAAALRLHELLDVSAMRETDEVRLLVEGVAAGLRAMIA